MGNTQSSLPGSLGTQFVNTEQPAVASYQQCHIFGDSSLYGVGIRTSYYLQYAAALLSLLFLRGQAQKHWFLSFVPLLAANLVVLSLNATSGGLVVLDWAIVFGLVFWSIVFLIWPVVRGVDQREGPGLAGNPKLLQQYLERELGRAVGDREADWHARYVDAVRVLGVGGKDDWEENQNRQDALEVALQDYVAAFASARFSPASTEAASYILNLYDDRVGDIATRMMMDNKQLEAFRDTHTEALRLANISFGQAQATTQALARVAVEGLASTTRSHIWSSPGQALKALGGRARHSATVSSCGFGLILYSGFSAFTVWLLFRGLDIGSRAGCNVRLVFFVVPASVYSRGAVIALRVLACIWLALVGAPSLLVGLALLAMGAMDWLLGTLSANRYQGRRKDVLGFAAVPYDSEKGKEAEVVSPVSMAGASRASDMLYEMEEYRQSMAPSTVRDTRGSSFFGSVLIKDPEPSSTEAKMRGGSAEKKRWSGLGARLKSQKLWKYLLVLPLAHTIAVVEMTIRINGLDMAQRPMSSTGELLAFFLGVLLFLRVLGKCVKEGMGFVRRQRSAGWLDERRQILSEPPNRLSDPEYGGGVLGKEISVGESSLGQDPEAMKGRQRKIYLQPEVKSGSSMGKFREMIDEDDQ